MQKDHDKNMDHQMEWMEICNNTKNFDTNTKLHVIQ